MINFYEFDDRILDRKCLKINGYIWRISITGLKSECHRSFICFLDNEKNENRIRFGYLFRVGPTDRAIYWADKVKLESLVTGRFFFYATDITTDKDKDPTLFCENNFKHSLLRNISKDEAQQAEEFMLRRLQYYQNWFLALPNDNLSLTKEEMPTVEQEGDKTIKQLESQFESSLNFKVDSKNI